MDLSLRGHLIEAQHNTDAINRALGLYQLYSRKTPAEVIEKQGGKLGYILSQRLRGIMPAKGSIRSERLAALRSGGGVRVRESVLRKIAQKYQARTNLATRSVVFGKRGVGTVSRKGGRRLNLRALAVQAELNVRERGRGFLSTSARWPRQLSGSDIVRSRFGPILEQSRITMTADEAQATFTWGAAGQLSREAAEGLQTPPGQRAIAASFNDLRRDILVYVQRKMLEDARRAGLNA